MSRAMTPDGLEPENELRLELRFGTNNKDRANMLRLQKAEGFTPDQWVIWPRGSSAITVERTDIYVSTHSGKTVISGHRDGHPVIAYPLADVREVRAWWIEKVGSSDEEQTGGSDEK